MRYGQIGEEGMAVAAWTVMLSADKQRRDGGLRAAGPSFDNILRGGH